MRKPELSPHEAALIGKAGEALVAAELLRRKVDVAYPAHDAGVDLIAYHMHEFGRVVPIQVKAGSKTLFNFQKDWFHIEGLVLVQVWYTATIPRFYIFGSISDVEDALGDRHIKTDSWIISGGYSVRTPSESHIERMQASRKQMGKNLRTAVKTTRINRHPF